MTATDGQGKYVTDLNEEDFEVYEDGAKQKLTFFSKTQQPISLALLLDTSASMDERMGIAQEAAIGFAKQLHKDDQAEVIDFDSQVRVLSPFTNDAAALEKAIRATTPNGSTSLYNALYIALKELKKSKAARLGRHPPPGDRAAVGRRRHLQPDRVRPGARPRQALRGRDLLDRPAAGGNRAAASSRKRSSC